MREEVGKCCAIRHVVRRCQLALRRWRERAASSAASPFSSSSRSSALLRRLRVPADVPAGHVAVCVGAGATRFVVRAAHLNHPAFRGLLVQAEEEYGFHRPGPLAIPCDEGLFKETLRCLDYSISSLHRASFWPSSCCCRPGDVQGSESLPLLGVFVSDAATATWAAS